MVSQMVGRMHRLSCHRQASNRCQSSACGSASVRTYLPQSSELRQHVPNPKGPRYCSGIIRSQIIIRVPNLENPHSALDPLGKLSITVTLVVAAFAVWLALRSACALALHSHPL